MENRRQRTRVCGPGIRTTDCDSENLSLEQLTEKSLQSVYGSECVMDVNVFGSSGGYHRV